MVPGGGSSAGPSAGARRGRRENAIDTAQPAHRVGFATRLRALRHECGRPSYRRLSELAHCSTASLSVAAAGRRLPTWGITKGYVAACLIHARRPADIDRELRSWRRVWEDAQARETVHRFVAPPARRPRGRRAGTVAILLAAVLVLLVAGSIVSRPPW